MSDTFSRLVARFNRLVNYFIPPAIRADREISNRAHVFLVSHILGPFIGNVVPAAIFFFDPHPGYEVAVLALSITAFWLFPFLLRAGVPYNPLALISVQNLIFCILWSCYFNGGVTSPTLPWVLTIPLLAFFYLGSSGSLRLIVIAMFVANLAIFVGLYQFGDPVKSPLPGAGMQGLGIVSTIAASLYVTMMALYYANVLASQTELESEMRQHVITTSELRLATIEAERAGSAKAEFLARMSHELRTPLNAVIGYSQMLLEDAGDDAQDISDLNKIHNAGQHLLKLVNEILDLSKIEAGKMELYLQPTDLAELLTDAVHAVTPAAARNGNRISCCLAPDLGTAMVDASKLSGLLGQLLDNAAKFTENGTIELNATVNDGELTIDVVDTGIGIAADQIPGLFEKFTVVDDCSTTKYGGTGLGLALSQKLCRLMGGEIFVLSQIGNGSRFTIRLPLTPAAAEIHADATLVPAMPTLDSTLLPAVASHA